MTTYAENTLHVATDLAFATTVVSNGVGIVAALYGGWLADRAGRWPVMVWPQLAALLLTYPVFLWIVDTRSAFALLGGLGVLSSHREIDAGAVSRIIIMATRPTAVANIMYQAGASALPVA